MATLGALDQFLNPTAGWLPDTSAQKLVDWTVSDELRKRIEDLGEKASRGDLTPREDAEYREYLEDAEIISLLQTKTRRLHRMNG